MRQFQSLLSWISRFGPRCNWEESRKARGFNPCCLGLAVLARWSRRLQLAVDGGFNPCCLGLAVLALQAPRPSREPFGFQSLLSWISRFGAADGGVCGIATKFQSLLSWISRFGILSPLLIGC